MESKNTTKETRRHSEKYIEKYLVNKVKRTKGMCIKMSPAGLIGIPDRLILVNGFAAFAELKSKGKKPSRIQQYTHQKLRDAGFPVSVIDSVEGVDALLEKLAELRGVFNPRPISEEDVDAALNPGKGVDRFIKRLANGENI